MPKPYSFPTLYNEALQIQVSKLKKWGFLETGHLKYGKINWSSNGNQTNSISIHANTLSEQPYIELEYKYGGKDRKYKVHLTSTPSNLRIGEIWYFICPKTNNRCRKLYLVDGYFFHREAFTGCMYESQTQSNKIRGLYRQMELFFKADELYEGMYKKHSRTFYNGKPTKRYLKFLKSLQGLQI